MLVIVGFIIVIGSVLGGYIMHHGQIGVLIQVSEFIIIGGAALGAMLMGNPLPAVKATFQRAFALAKGNPFTQKAYSELLTFLYEVFALAKKDGLLALEKHVESPHESELFKKYPTLAHNHHAVSFFADTVKVLLSGAIEAHHLGEMLEVDIEQHAEEALVASHVLARTSDAMPGFGIVAAVLGVVVTMGAIGGAAAEIGEKVGAALVGTFLGILLAYGVLSPLSQACEGQAKAETAYLVCLKVALIAFANGEPPMTAVEFARRSIEPGVRISFTELELLLKEQKGK
ncbi:flagellar motor stator protein MotA [Armatimonas sp.]|uniref:flagellar motor stator protein MotA n=1 Tax=Armatimonas sp. TaxID=1872638 RepID=UPI00286AC994|nr:flagellar motor stator protein MotA [Armatimonas sp.]